MPIAQPNTLTLLAFFNLAIERGAGRIEVVRRAIDVATYLGAAIPINAVDGITAACLCNPPGSRTAKRRHERAAAARQTATSVAQAAARDKIQDEQANGAAGSSIVAGSTALSAQPTVEETLAEADSLAEAETIASLILLGHRSPSVKSVELDLREAPPRSAAPPSIPPSPPVMTPVSKQGHAQTPGTAPATTPTTHKRAESDAGLDDGDRTSVLRQAVLVALFATPSVYRGPQRRMDRIVRRRHIRTTLQLQLGRRERQRLAEHGGHGRLAQEWRPSPRPLCPLQVRPAQHRIGRTRYVVPVRRPEPAQLCMALAPMGRSTPLPRKRAGTHLARLFSPSGDGRPFTGGQADGLLRVVLGLVMGSGGRTANVALLPHHPRHAALRKARRSAWPWDRTRRSSRPGREEGRSVSVNLLIRRTTLDDPKATTTPKDGCDDSGTLAACGPKLLPRSDHYLDHYDSRRTGRHLR